jgi:2-methylisocitrate lyase-like PEP mutase family enzyme
MGLEENLQTCRAMVACCDLPMIADGDTGYGNAVNVHHQYERLNKLVWVA